jgi:hypothetical protein
MNVQLTQAIAQWAAETGRCAADLPTLAAREAYLRERRRALVAGIADTCIDAARRIMTEILAQRAGEPRGHA